MTLSDLKEELHNRVLHGRSIEAIISSDKFERLWQDSTVAQRELVTNAALFGYKSRVTEWIKSHESLELGEHSLAYLKDIAKKLRIAHYSRLSKAALISAIEAKENKE